MEKQIPIIEDLQEYLGENRGEHVIFSGTFDPFHLAHLHMAYLGALAGERLETPRPLILAPHSRTRGKKPAPIEQRIEWMIRTIQEEGEIGDLASKVVIAKDLHRDEDLESWRDLRRIFAHRLIRVAGSDKAIGMATDRTSVNAKYFFLPRIGSTSSTGIREAFRSGNPESIEGIISRSVFEDIKKTGVYSLHPELSQPSLASSASPSPHQTPGNTKPDVF